MITKIPTDMYYVVMSEWR